MRAPRLFFLLVALCLACGGWEWSVSAERPLFVPSLNESFVYYVPDATIVSLEQSIAVVSLGFDQPLYLNDMLLCPEATESCPTFASVGCQACDWSEPVSGGNYCDGGEVAANCCGPLGSADSNTAANLDEWCTPSTTIHSVSATLSPYASSANSTAASRNVRSRYSALVNVTRGETATFRFYLDPTTDWCSPVRLIVHHQYGDTELYYSNRYAVPSSKAYDWLSANTVAGYGFAQTWADLCPNWHPNYGMGTYAVTVQATLDSAFYLELAVGDPQPLQAPSSSGFTCADVTNPFKGATCVDNGESYVLQFSNDEVSLAQLVLPVPAGCYTLGAVAFPSVQDAIDLGTDVDLFCGQVTQQDSPSLSNSVGSRYRTGPDSVTFTVCSDVDWLLYCALQPWVGGEAVFSWSTSAPVIRTPVTDVSRYDFGVLAGLSSTMIQFFNTLIQTTCLDWYDACNTNWATYPASDPLVFWPPQSPFSTVFGDVYITAPPAYLIDLLSSPLPNQLVLTVAFSSTVVQVPFALDDFLTRATLIVPRISSASGEPVQFPTGFAASTGSSPGEVVGGFPAVRVSQLAAGLTRELGQQCTPSSFSEVFERMSELVADISAAETLSTLVDLRYDLDSYSTSIAYRSCLYYVRSLLVNSSTSVLTTVTSCQWSSEPNSTEYNADPCCNSEAVALSCCSGREVTETTAMFSAPTTTADIKGACKNSRCALSYLEQLASGLNALSEGKCSDPSTTTTNALYRDATYQIRHCRNLAGIGEDFNGVACAADTDCDFMQSTDSVCVGGLCSLPDLATTETVFLACFVDSLSVPFEDYLRKNVLPSSLGDAPKTSPAFLAAVRAAATVPDCVGATALDLDARTRNVYYSDDQVCVASYSDDCPKSPVCLDSLCYVPAAQCFRYCQADWHSFVATQDTCQAVAPVCPLSDDSGVDCPSSSSSSTGVCVYCPEDGDLPCTSFAGSPTSESACNDAIACLLPNGELLFGLTASQCASQASACSHDCSTTTTTTSCQSFLSLSGACFFAMGGGGTCTQPDTTAFESSTCVSSTIGDQSTCTTAGGSWSSCQSMASCDNTTVERRYLQCFESRWRACTDENDCTQNGGLCSDRPFAQSYSYSASEQSGRYQWGACFTSGYFQNWITDQTTECLANEARVPNGCLSSDVTSQADCSPENEASGTKSYREWMTPALTASECLGSAQPGVRARSGCLFILENRTLWYDEAACSACDGVFTSAFTWTAGEWLAPRARPLSWIENPSTPVSQYSWRTDALSFFTIDDWLQSFVSYRASFALRSEALCSTGLVSTSLDALVCSCAEHHEGCFENLPVTGLIGIVSPCYGTELVVSPPQSRFSFSNESVLSGCVQIDLDQVSASSLRVAPVQPSVSFQLARRHLHAGVVVNRYNKRVGLLSGDGLTFTIDINAGSVADSMNVFELCLAPTNNETAAIDRYSVADFAQSHDSYKTVVPAGLPIEVRYVNGTYLWCTNVTPTAAEFNYFPVWRLEDYQDFNPSELATSDEALIYTLAALYSLVFILVAGHAISVIYARITMGGKFSYYSFVVPDFLFITVFRQVYIYAYPSGLWEDHSVANFIVFEMPTFFYFSAFLIVLGIFFNALTALRPDLTRRFRYGLYVALVLMWSLFIAVAVAVAVIGTGGTSACPGRVPDSTGAATQIRNLSIAYQSIVITFTVLYAVAFLLTAWLLIKRVSGAQKSVRRAIALMQDLLLSTIIMVCGFVARSCLFIIVLALQLESTIYMFITLFLTEICVITSVEVMWIRLSLAPHVASSQFSSGLSGGPTRGASEFSMPEPEREPIPDD